MQTQELLVIDQAPLVNEAMDSCQRAFRTIERLKSDLHQFETLDLPAYGRWYNTSFGRYLTELRELTALLGEKEALLALVRKRHWSKFFNDSDGPLGEPSYSESGTRRTQRVGSGYDQSENSEEFGSEQEEYVYEEGSYYDDESEAYFEEDEDSRRWFEELLNRGDDWRDAGYRTRSSDEEEDYRERGPRHRSQSQKRQEAQMSPEKLDALRARLKERYRLLVRRLHPDLNPDLTPEHKSLWNRVQLAYQEKSLEKLDLLLALSDAFVGSLSKTTGLTHLRKVAEEIERLVGPLRKKLVEAQKNRAWNFSQAPDHSRLHRIVESEFQRDLNGLRHTLVQLDQQIQRFSRSAQTSQSPQAKPSRNRGSEFSDQML